MKRIPVTNASYKKIPERRRAPGKVTFEAKSGRVDKEKTRIASTMGIMGRGGFNNMPSLLGSSSFYNSSYMSGAGIGLSTGMGDIPLYFAFLNEQNGGVLYYPTTLKERYEWYRYFVRADAYVSAAVKLHTDLPMSRLILRMPKMKDKKRRKKILTKYENMVHNIKLFDKLHSILFEVNVIGNCFPAGHLVMTSLGEVPIEQLRPGDLVLSENGEFNTVIHNMRRYADEYLYEINVEKMRGFPISPTGEHPVFVLKDDNIVCVEAKDLRVGDYVSLAHYNTEKDVKSVSLSKWFKENEYFNSKYDRVDVSLDDNRILIDCEYVTNSNKTVDRKEFEQSLLGYLSNKTFPFRKKIKDVCSDLGYSEEHHNIYNFLRQLRKSGFVNYRMIPVKGDDANSRWTTEWISCDCSLLETGGKWNKHFEVNISDLEISNEFLYLLGYFYGDGWLWKYKRPQSYSYLGIDWIFYSTSSEQYEFCAKLAEKVFGCEVDIDGNFMMDSDNFNHITVPNPMIAEWWSYNFGEHSNNKKVPVWIEQLPIDKLKWLLAGFIDSDGCVSNQTVELAATNKKLMSSFFRVGLKCGVAFNINEGKSRTVVLPNGEKINSRKTYSLVNNGKNDAFEHSVKYQNSNIDEWGEAVHDVKKIANRYFYPIASINKKHFSGYVYNIEVDNEHTYCVNNINTHNCFVFLQYSEEKKEWDKIVILPPEEVDVATIPMSDVVRIRYRPEQLRNVLNKHSLPLDDYDEYCKHIEGLDEDDRESLRGVDFELVKQLQENNGALIMDTSPYLGDENSKIGSFVYHFSEKRHEYHDLGVSPLECILTPLLMKEHYKHTQLSLASRNMTPRNVVTADGISAEALDELREQVDQSMLSPDYSIVTNYQLNWDTIGADNRLIDLQREYDTIEDQIFAGLGVTRELLTGEGLYSGNKISIEILNTRYLLKRELLQRLVEESLFKPIALENGFYEDDEDGNRTWFYPRLSFSRMTIRDNAEVFDSLFQMYQKGSIPVGTILDLFNLDEDEIDEKLKKDMFTVKDATFNDMLRGIYSDIGSKIAENTDLAEQIANTMFGPSGIKLKYEEASEEDEYGGGGYGDYEQNLGGGEVSDGDSIDDDELVFDDLIDNEENLDVLTDGRETDDAEESAEDLVDDYLNGLLKEDKEASFKVAGKRRRK